MVKLADTQDLGSCASRLAGSNPASPTRRYIPGTSFTVHSGHMVYTIAYLTYQEESYAVEGDQSYG